MPNGRNIPDWVSAAVALVVLVSGGIGIYGASIAETATLSSYVEQNRAVSQSNLNRLNDVDSDLHLITTQVTVISESLSTVQKTQEQFNNAVLRLADATERLNISVARLEERIGNAKER